MEDMVTSGHEIHADGRLSAGMKSSAYSCRSRNHVAQIPGGTAGVDRREGRRFMCNQRLVVLPRNHVVFPEFPCRYDFGPPIDGGVTNILLSTNIHSAD